MIKEVNHYLILVIFIAGYLLKPMCKQSLGFAWIGGHFDKHHGGFSEGALHLVYLILLDVKASRKA